MCEQLRQRIIEISKSKNLAHLSSCLTMVGILDEVFSQKEEDDVVILSAGHAALALYVVLEKYEGIDAEFLFDKHGVHPNRDLENKIYLSTGSLGMGITVAVGSALASPNKKVYCLLSDGECAEGSVWEALAFIHKENIKNIKVFINANGFSAYDTVDIGNLRQRVSSFCSPNVCTVVDTSRHHSRWPLEGNLLDHYRKI